MAQPPPIPSGPPPNIETFVSAVCVKDYTPFEPNHISLHVGDVIKVTEFGEKLLWYGTLVGNGAKGVFPSSHVEIRGRGRGRGGLTRGTEGRGGLRHSSYVPSNNTQQMNNNTTTQSSTPPPFRPKSGYTNAPLVDDSKRPLPPPPPVPRANRPLQNSAPPVVEANGATSPLASSLRGALRGRGTGRGLSNSNPPSPVTTHKDVAPLSPNSRNNDNSIQINNNNNENNSTPPPPAPSQANQDGTKKKTREDLRNDTLQELYETEKGYIEDLETLINVFIFPLKTMSVIPDSVLYNIFSNVEVLINCNREMLKALEEKMTANTENEEVSIGACFTMLADYFKMYKVYCANQSTSLTTFETQLKKNSQFKKNLEVCQSDPRCRGLTLQSFLIKPIQRVCKYPLLLRELIRYTPEDHPDYDPLQSAFTKINEVVTNINEAQREFEGLQRILDLQKLIDGIDTLVEPGRRFHKEGDLTFFKTQKSKHGEKRHVFFFSDLILLTTRKGEKRYEHKLSIPLGNCTLIVLADSEYIKNAFELSQKSLKKPCILSGDTPEELNQWTREIKNLIKMYQKKEIELKKKGFAVSDD